MPKYWVEDVNGTKVLHEYEDGTLSDPVVPSTARPGAEIASVVMTTTFTPTNTTQQDVTGMSLVVPANSGPVILQCPGGVLATVVTGTQPSTTPQRFSLYLVDETNATIGYSAWLLYGTGVTQSLGNTLPLGTVLPNQPIDKTYRMQIQVQRQGASGASGNIGAGGVFPNLVLQAIRR